MSAGVFIAWEEGVLGREREHKKRKAGAQAHLLRGSLPISTCSATMSGQRAQEGTGGPAPSQGDARARWRRQNSAQTCLAGREEAVGFDAAPGPAARGPSTPAAWRGGRVSVK